MACGHIGEIAVARSAHVIDGYINVQLIVTHRNATFTAMANSREREEFSKRLKQALQRAGVNADSPTRLAEAFSTRYTGTAVTQQAVRKWLGGEAIPAQDKIRALALWLGCGTEWLRYGKDGGVAPGVQQPAAAYRVALSGTELLKRYNQLSATHQQMVSEIVSALSTGRKR